MRLFWYRAMNAEGAIVKGSGEHADLHELVAGLTAQGLQPYRVWSLPGWLHELFYRPLGPGAVAEFCYLISQHVRAGADLRLALDEASRGASTARLRMLCARIKRAVERGDRLATALGDTRAFPSIVMNLVTVGEETGRLGTILDAAAAQFEQMRQLRQAIMRSLIYPSIVMLILLLSSVYWMVVVIPKMSLLFSSLNVELPPITQRVIATTDWLRDYGIWPSLVLLVMVMFIVPVWNHPAIQPLLHRVMWWTPGVSKFERTRVHHAFFSNLGAMQGAGLTMSRTLMVLLQQPGNQYFGRRIKRISAGTNRGQSLSEGLTNSGVFDGFSLSMIRLGESTGTLEQQCLRLGEHYAGRLKQQIETGSRLFEPLVLLLLAAMLLLIGTTLLGPVYELAARASFELKP